jgi:hypothetical protein
MPGEHRFADRIFFEPLNKILTELYWQRNAFEALISTLKRWRWTFESEIHWLLVSEWPVIGTEEPEGKVKVVPLQFDQIEPAMMTELA